MTSWRRLAAGTAGLFLIVLAFLAGQLRAGADPALGRGAAQTQTAPAQPDPSTSEDGDEDGDGDDGMLPWDDGSSGDTGPGDTLPDAAPPTTHQS